MASFPSSKVHRVNRRKLGRGQSPSRPGVTCTPTVVTTTVTLTFSAPVVVSGIIPVSYNSGAITIVSQVQTSPTVVTQLVSASAAAASYSTANPMPNVSTAQLIGNSISVGLDHNPGKRWETSEARGLGG